MTNPGIGNQPTSSRMVPVRPGLEVFTRAVGERTERTALVCIHGGPGAVSHEGLEPLEALAATGRQVIFYDQIGCGRSSRPDDPSVWGFDLTTDEIDGIRRSYGLEQVVLLGHSYGGYIAQEYAIRQPVGLRGIVLADTSCDVNAYLAEGRAIRATLPEDVQRTLARHEARGSTDSEEYAAAYDVFLERFLCKLRPLPEPILRGRAGGNPMMTSVMWGSAGFAFNLDGTLRDWSVRDLLPTVEVPALVITGSDDMASPALAKMMADGLPDAQLVVIEGGSHTPFYEDPDGFCGAVAEFLAECDANDVPAGFTPNSLP